MASKRAGSQGTDGNVARATVEWVSSSLSIYANTKLYLDRDIKLNWQDVNEEFAGTFEEDLKYCQVYVNIHKSRLYRIACRYPVFPSVDMIHWIISHIDPETMTLSNVSGTKLVTFWTWYYDEMYQMSEPMTVMKTPFNLPNSSANSGDILKNWIKELARFRLAPNQI